MAGVKTLKEGQLVLLASGNTWAEELVGPAAGFLPLPDLGPIGANVIEQLAMSAVNPLTALLMLTSFEDIKEGQWIAQSAANSAVGGYVIQLAKQQGIKTVNIVRRCSAVHAQGISRNLICVKDVQRTIAIIGKEVGDIDQCGNRAQTNRL